MSEENGCLESEEIKEVCEEAAAEEAAEEEAAAEEPCDITETNE